MSQLNFERLNTLGKINSYSERCYDNFISASSGRYSNTSQRNLMNINKLYFYAKEKILSNSKPLGTEQSNTVLNILCSVLSANCLVLEKNNLSGWKKENTIKLISDILFQIRGLNLDSSGRSVLATVYSLNKGIISKYEII